MAAARDAADRARAPPAHGRPRARRRGGASCARACRGPRWSPSGAKGSGASTRSGASATFARPGRRAPAGRALARRRARPAHLGVPAARLRRGRSRAARAARSRARARPRAARPGLGARVPRGVWHGRRVAGGGRSACSREPRSSHRPGRRGWGRAAPFFFSSYDTVPSFRTTHTHARSRTRHLSAWSPPSRSSPRPPRSWRRPCASPAASACRCTAAARPCSSRRASLADAPPALHRHVSRDARARHARRARRRAAGDVRGRVRGGGRARRRHRRAVCALVLRRQAARLRARPPRRAVRPGRDADARRRHRRAPAGGVGRPADAHPARRQRLRRRGRQRRHPRLHLAGRARRRRRRRAHV